MLRNVQAHAARGDLSPTTVRYAYSVLRIALGRAMKLGYVSRNVATLVDPPAKAYHELGAVHGRAGEDAPGRHGQGPAQRAVSDSGRDRATAG
jgi:hypothetical protein